MKRHIAGVAVALTLASGLASAPSGAMAAEPAPAPSAPAAVSAIGARVAWTTSTTMRVVVTYTCTDAPAPDGTVHYLQAGLTQGARAGYVVGYRSDTGGLLAATCTGKPVTSTLTLGRSGYADPAARDPRAGGAKVSVTLATRATDDAGGWYVTKGDDVTAQRAVTVLCKPRFLKKGARLPASC